MLVRVLVGAVLLTAVTSIPAAQPAPTLPERFTALAVSLGGPRTEGGATQIEMTINQWSTPEQTKRLMGVMKDKGAEALLDTLREMKPVGTISTPGNLAYDLHYAHQEPAADGGRRIFLATDRPITYWQAVNQPRVVNYPFTFIELRMNGKGEGEGKLALATKINVSDEGKTIELVSYRTQPIQLNQVRRRTN